MWTHPCARTSGITTIELLICLVIVSILSAIAIPDLRDLYYRHQAQDIMRRLSHLILNARNQAITHSSFTTLCPSVDAETCKGEWEEGLILFVDHNHNRRLDPDETLLWQAIPFSAQGSLRWRSLRQAIQFNSRGMPYGTVGSFVFCPLPGRPELGSARIMSFQGRLRQGWDSNEDQIVETRPGKNISC